MFKSSKNKNELLFEEAIADTESQNLESVEMPLSRGAFALVAFATLFVGAVFLSRVSILNAKEGDFYKRRSLVNMSNFTVLPAERGVFFDRFGKALVKNFPTFRAVLKLSDFLKKPADARDKEINDLAAVLNLEAQEIKKWVEDSDLEKQNLIIIGRNLSIEQVANVKNLGYLDVDVQNDFIRAYEESDALSHIAGYVGPVSKKDLNENPDLLLNDVIGKSGLEFFYDNYLRGKNGEILEYKNARNESLGEKSTVEPEKGNNLHLTVDSELQAYFSKRLQDQLASLGKTSGAGIVINPNTGEVLSLVSLPGFNNNKIKSNDLTDSSRPLFNRVVAGLYNPASTIKPLDGVAALTEGVVDPLKSIFSAGYIEIPNPYTPDQPSRFNDWKAHGWINLYSALARSSNVYFYEVGGGFQEQKGLGISNLRKYWQIFNLDQKTGIDLPGEKSGFLPDPQEKEKRTGTPWRIGDTYHVSIGQGDLSITPLELINYISAIATRGKMYKPFLVEKITDEGGKLIKENNPEAIKDISYLSPAMDEVEFGMIDGVRKDYGTSHMLYDIPFTIAAKTGSAQYAGNAKINAFFTGYIVDSERMEGEKPAPVSGLPIEEVPKEKQIAVLVLIEDARDGGGNAVPVAYDLFKWYYWNRIIKNN